MDQKLEQLIKYIKNEAGIVIKYLFFNILVKIDYFMVHFVKREIEKSMIYLYLLILLLKRLFERTIRENRAFAKMVLIEDCFFLTFPVCF